MRSKWVAMESVSQPLVRPDRLLIHFSCSNLGRDRQGGAHIAHRSGFSSLPKEGLPLALFDNSIFNSFIERKERSRPGDPLPTNYATKSYIVPRAPGSISYILYSPRFPKVTNYGHLFPRIAIAISDRENARADLEASAPGPVVL